jgi:cell division initiation protein
MEIDARVLKEVEFSTSLRGYNTDEVDEFLEQVTIAVERLRTEANQAIERADAAERLARDQPAADLDESIRKTLVLAQRTADMAVKEAEDEAKQIRDHATSEAQILVADARDSAMRITSDAERRLRDEVDRLTGNRDQLAKEVETLVAMLGAERARLAESLTSVLRHVQDSLANSPDLETYLSTARPTKPEPNGLEGGVESTVSEPEEAGPRPATMGPEDDVEAAIAADAAAAAPAPPPGNESDQYDWDSVIRGRSDEPPLGSLGPDRPRLTSLSSRDSLEDTAAWQMRAPRSDWPA